MCNEKRYYIDTTKLHIEFVKKLSASYWTGENGSNTSSTFLLMWLNKMLHQVFICSDTCQRTKRVK